MREELSNDNSLDIIFEEFENECFGQILESSELPLNFRPTIDINGQSPELFKEDWFSLKNNEEKLIIFNEEVGKNIIDNLLEITIHFNTSKENLSHLDKGYLQYPFPHIGKYQEINIQSLEEFFNQETPSLNRINIIVGEINSENFFKINKLIKYFQKKATIFLYSFYENYDILSNLEVDSDHIYLWGSYMDFKNLHKKKYNWLGIATNHDEYSNYKKLKGCLLEYYPIYTGSNMLFCKELMCFEKEDVLSLHLNEKNIFANQILNTNFFGEITILPDGNIHSCINCLPIGNIKRENLKQILFDEFSIHKFWFTTRLKAESCKNCLYNFVCPPITNFELCLNKTDLCDK